MDIVPPEKAEELDPASYNNYQEYIKAQHRLWLDEEIAGDFDDPDWRIAFGNSIKEHLFFQNLLKALGGGIHSFDDIFIKLEKVTKGLKTDDHFYTSEHAQQFACPDFRSPDQGRFQRA